MSSQLRIERLDLMQVNVFLLESRGRRILIDTGGIQTLKKLRAKLAKAGIHKGDIELIVLTHAHPDHAGGAGALRDELSAPVAIHGAEAAWLDDGAAQLYEPCGIFGRILSKTIDRQFPAFEPDEVLVDAQRLTSYGFDIEVVHTPGHTPGSICLLHDSGQVVVGDLLGGGLLRRDRPRSPFFVQDRSRLNQSVRQVLDRHPSTWHFGHGKQAAGPAMGRRWKEL